MTCNMARKLKNVENETQTLFHLEYVEKTEKNVENETQKLFELEYGEKHLKTWTMRNEHCRAWIMARKLQIMENEKHTVQDL